MDEPSCSHSKSKSPAHMSSPDDKRLIVSLSDSTSSDDDDELPKQLSAFDTLKFNDQLEEKLKKHGLNRRNVKNIIHELLSNEDVVKMFKSSSEGNESPPNLPEPRCLRSSKKISPDPKKGPTITEIQFQDDDDEDEDYKPGMEENTVDMEDCVSQDTLTSAHDLDTSLEDTDKSDTTMATRTSSFIHDLNQIDSELKAIDEGARNTLLNDDEIIAQRTRSKHSLLDITMMELETAFNPPDATEDIYTPTGGEEWHRWLAELMMDDTVTNRVDAPDEDDKEIDPDYDFIASEADDINEREDFRDDPATRISKKEVQELLELLEVPAIDYRGQSLNSPPEPKPKSSNTGKQVSVAVKPLSLKDSNVTVKQHLQLVHEQKSSKPVTILQKNPHVPPSTSFVFTNKQRSDLNLQLRQHVQLLTQVNLLCRNSPKLEEISGESLSLLKELEQLGDYNKASMHISESSFCVSSLKEAVQIAERAIVESEPVTRLSKQERNKGSIPIPRNIAVTMATSGVFQFSELLPISSAICDQSRLTFTLPEDNLLTLGLAQMEGHNVACNILIHQYMMPSKQPEQIRWRITNAKHRQYHPHNSIRIFRSSGKLPKPPPILQPDAGAGTGAPTLLQLESSKLPGWLVALQLEEKRSHLDPAIPVYEETENPASSTHNTSSPEQNKLLIHCTSQTSLPAGAVLLPAIVNNPPQTVQHLTPIRSRPVADGVDRSSPRKKLLNLKKRRIEARSPRQPPIGVGARKREKILIPSKHNPQHKLPASNNATYESKADEMIVDSTNVTAVEDMIVDKPNKVSLPILSVEESLKRSNVGINADMEKPSSAEVDGNSMTLTIKANDDPSPAPDDADDEAMTEDDDFNDPDTEEDETHAKSQGGKEDDVASDEDTMTEEEPIETVEEEKQEEGKKMEVGGERWSKGRKVRWKNRSGKISKKLGGRLHRLHPGLSGKKPRIADEDQLSRSLRKSAENVRLLEEDTIVQLDPSRVEKEMMFAEGYLKKMEEALKDHPEILVKVLEMMCEFDLDSSQSPSSLFLRLSEILHPWPNLLKGFAPFLLPEQAEACGLLPEQQVYARARKFLRQLEIRFQDNPHHLNRILTAFHAVAEGSIHTEQEMKKVVLGLLKADPYLQEEFLMFFDDERPPESRLHGDYEEVVWTDDLIKDAENPFEQVYIPSAEGQDNVQAMEEGHGEDLLKSPQTHTKSRIKSQDVNFNMVKENVDPRQSETKETEQQTVNRGVTRDWEDAPRSEEESDIEEMEQTAPPPALGSSCLPPDIGVISEDALSCSPFKRHNSSSLHPQSSLSQQFDRPKTPTNTAESHETISLPERVVRESQSSSVGSNLPTTPTGSPDKAIAQKRLNAQKPNEQESSWTRDEDALLLSVCKDMGPCEEAFKKASDVLKRSDTEARFAHLMALLAGEDLSDESDDDDTEHSDSSDD